MSNHSNRGKKFGDMVDRSASWMGCADLEIERAKKASLSITSRYYKKRTWTDHATTRYGFTFSPLAEVERLGSHEEWLRAYKYFCKQKVNTKGQKVDRSHLLKYQYNAEKFGSKKDEEN